MRNSRSALAMVILAVLIPCLIGCSSGHESASGTGSDTAAGETTAITETTVNATTEHVRFIGRTCEADGVAWLPQSGSAAEFLVAGTHVEVEVVGDDSVNGEQNHRPRFAVLVDGKVVVDDVLNEPSRTIEVLNSQNPTSATVEVIHLSEAQHGAIGIRSITVESGSVEPVVPTAARELSIEFIGDSITCAYGVEAASVDEHFSTATENFMDSYAYHTAQALGADYSAVCYSGYGIVSGWSGDGTRNADMLLPPLYDLVASGYDHPWDSKANRYDVVVINLGTNDFTYTGTDKNRLHEFAVGYEAFLAHVRALNPDSYIVCTMGTMGCEELYPSLEQAVESFRAQTGDERVMCYLSDPIDIGRDGAGAGGHPNRISQQKCADQLEHVIRQALEM